MALWGHLGPLFRGERERREELTEAHAGLGRGSPCPIRLGNHDDGLLATTRHPLRLSPEGSIDDIAKTRAGVLDAPTIRVRLCCAVFHLYIMYKTAADASMFSGFAHDNIDQISTAAITHSAAATQRERRASASPMPSRLSGVSEKPRSVARSSLPSTRSARSARSGRSPTTPRRVESPRPASSMRPTGPRLRSIHSRTTGSEVDHMSSFG